MKKQGSFLRDAGLISIATLLSRILGLAREQIFAYYFGAGMIVDAFQIAFRIPNLLRDLFAEGSMSSALVPIYTDLREKRGEDYAWELVRKLVSVLGVTLIAISSLGIFFAEKIVRIFPLEGSPEKFALTVHLTQIMIPFLPTVVMAAIWMSVLNAREKFAIPALAPTLFNLISIFSAFTICPLMKNMGIEPIYGMAIGVVLGGLGQWFFQYPSLRREGFRFRPTFVWRDSDLARIATLMMFGVVGMAATQVNVMVNSFLALSQGDGAVAWLNYAFRLMQFPLGIFGVAIAQVTLTKVARSTAQNNLLDVSETVVKALRVAIIITLPSAVGLIALGYPIISIIFEYGKFTSEDSRATALALACYAVGLVGYSSNKVMVPVLYSLGKANLAVLSSLLTVVSNIFLCLVLLKPLGFAGLALATSLTAYINFITLLIWISKYSNGLAWKSLFTGAIYSVFASFLMWVLLRIYWGYIAEYWQESGFFLHFCILLAGLSLGAGTYWIGIKLLGLKEANDIERMIREKILRKIFGRSNEQGKVGF